MPDRAPLNSATCGSRQSAHDRGEQDFVGQALPGFTATASAPVQGISALDQSPLRTSCWPSEALRI